MQRETAGCQHERGHGGHEQPDEAFLSQIQKPFLVGDFITEHRPFIKKAGN